MKAVRESLDKKLTDKMIIPDIYDVAGRENERIKKTVNSEKLVKSIKRESALYLQKDKIISFVEKNASGIDVLIIMGAGDIYDFDVCLTKGR